MNRMRSILAVALLVSPLCADTRDFVASVRGNATVNGNAVNTQSVNLAPGDLINTNAGSVQLNGTGTIATLPHNTSAMLKGGELRIGCGSAAVTTRTALATHVAGIDVSPTVSDRSEYTIVTGDGVTTISALKGSLKISSGSKSMTLAAGRAVRLQAVCNNSPADEGELVYATLSDKLGSVTPLGGNYTSPVGMAAVLAGTAAVVAVVIWVLSNENISPR
ncbi:MAG: hypothetical protein JOZ43_04830 [Acidobacteriales bacterium]|nr:hypothetical protein [Terriglobales bacterium]